MSLKSRTFKLNPITSTDSYKLAHARMYPAGTTQIYSNFTPRSNAHLNVPAAFKTNKIVWFGAQGVIRQMQEEWQENFFDAPLDAVINQFKSRTAPFTGDYPVDIASITALHKLGYLPIKIKALAEGSRVNIGVPVFTIVNTKPEFYWLTNYLESYLSTESWKPTTTATIADIYRQIITRYANETGGNKDFIDFQGHDFSMRGMSNSMDSAKSGAGHLTAFKGSDTLSAVDYLEYFYAASNTFVAASVPATEHSVMCISGVADEKETIRRLIQDLYPTGIVSVVSDSWDFWRVISVYAAQLKDIILKRQPDSMGFAKVVFRPDSGDPVEIICGAESPKDNSPAELGAVEVLWNIFGGTVNEKGFKTLNQRVGLIYGDSITPQRADDILRRLKAKGFASDNIVLGIGSYTYQYLTRDTLGFAMKATYGVVNGAGVEIVKNPITDSGTKKSAKGLLRVENENGEFVLYDQQTTAQETQGELKLVFEDGEFFNPTSLTEIRERLIKS
jgi:nicotinamide phosphoribosyltransferase